MGASDRMCSSMWQCPWSCCHLTGPAAVQSHVTSLPNMQSCECVSTDTVEQREHTFQHSFHDVRGATLVEQLPLLTSLQLSLCYRLLQALSSG